MRRFRHKSLGRPEPNYLSLIHKLGPELLRVIAAAVAHERSFGSVPSAEQVVALAEAEGASADAALVAVRWELRNAKGEVVPLCGPRLYYGNVVVRDAATLWALEAFSLRGIFVGLRTVEGRVLPKHSLTLHAASW
jgi:hypothetical protein